jgi:hypothetical protein
MRDSVGRFVVKMEAAEKVEAPANPLTVLQQQLAPRRSAKHGERQQT